MKTKLSRRAFLKQMGVGATAMVAAHLLSSQAQAAHASGDATVPSWAVLIDLSRCVGCNSCALACKAVNNLPDSNVEPQGLSSESYSFVDTRQVTTATGESTTRFVKRQCMHCVDPACVSACPAAAMYKTEAGPVVYRSERCLGCRYCQMACPFEVPSFEWDNGITPVISKCWMCNSRLQEDQKPACVEACPTGALQFGQRDHLIARAHGQIAANPDRYVNHIFGEHEVGGTSMLYLSDIPFEELGFPANLPESAPSEETEKIMRTLPFVITGVAALMVGTAAYTHRPSAHSSITITPPSPDERKE